MRIMLIIIILLLVFCSTAVSQTETYYECDFETKCEDFIFDSYWFFENTSSHADHTYGNISGHYITYTNTSDSQPLTTFYIRDWVDHPSNLTACLSQWIYSGPGEVYWEVELAQGDDLQARLPVGVFGMNMNDPQWRGTSVEFPYANHYIPYVIFTNITSALDIDDLSVESCLSASPIPSITTVLDCDFDQTLCPDLLSLSNYSYSWSKIQAEEAQNFTSEAPVVDYSVGTETGHYIWLNNSDTLQFGGAGYLKTNVFRFTSSDSTYCLSFHYYQFGFTFERSRLTVLALQEGNETSVAQVWPINPINYTYINNRWSWAYAPLLIGNYSLLFRMESDYKSNSSFALDSISVHSCGYLQKYFYGTSHLEFVCNFDSSFDNTCGIRDDYRGLNPQSVINYTIRSPNNIDDRELGPRQTIGWDGDQFIYWSRSEQTSLTLLNGQFKTPLIEMNSEMCLRFAYFVNSTTVQPFNTVIQITAPDCRGTMWSVALTSSLGWQIETIPLRPAACTGSVYFQITHQRPTRVAVAFSGITIVQCGSLPVLTTTVPPSTTTTPFNKSSSNYINFVLLITVLLFLSNIYFLYNN